ncbi:MAG: hypothetical protein PHE17_02740 [Thiothrix sp.]|uniref:hypothetical protein n=1 Tax=Thiothrix sp. TaxID=1032 RepID=UPI00260EA64B|nr:hypothetical protein [Thiothrix sp.]MDD5391918.1 hypothetical protein [Thiothrix sp.]
MLRKSLTISLISLTLLLSACGNDDAGKDAGKPTASASPTQTAPDAGSKFAITSNAAGLVQLGMSLDDVLAALPDATTKTEQGGDGIEWTNIELKGKAVMSVLLNEDHTVSLIRVFSPQFTTEQGVTVGENLQSAADKLGGLNEIQSTEIESREFATFKNASPSMEFQVIGKDGSAGVYNNNETTTAVASPSATIHSIWIMED